MDDLTKLPLVGKASARKLVAAGFDTYAKVAGTTLAELQAIMTGAKPEDLGELQDAAKTLAPAAPINLQIATPSQVNDQAALIDAAREKLKLAGDAAVTAQASGTAEDLANAQAAVTAAQEELDKLIGTGTAPAAESVNPSTDTESTHTPQSDAAVGEAGQPGASLPGAEALAELGRDFDAAMVDLNARIQRMVDEDGSQVALAFIADQLELSQGVARHMTNVTAELESIKLQLLKAGADMAEGIAIVVSGPRKGRWRAGHFFGPGDTPVTVSAAELEAIDADPTLNWSLGSEEV